MALLQLDHWSETVLHHRKIFHTRNRHQLFLFTSNRFFQISTYFKLIILLMYQPWLALIGFLYRDKQGNKTWQFHYKYDRFASSQYLNQHREANLFIYFYITCVTNLLFVAMCLQAVCKRWDNISSSGILTDWNTTETISQGMETATVQSPRW